MSSLKSHLELSCAYAGALMGFMGVALLRSGPTLAGSCYVLLAALCFVVAVRSNLEGTHAVAPKATTDQEQQEGGVKRVAWCDGRRAHARSSAEARHRKTRIRPAGGSVRCPYCRTDIDRPARKCTACHAVQHISCLAESQGCTTYGCKNAPRRRAVHQ